jgi:hypothetical protein
MNIFNQSLMLLVTIVSLVILAVTARANKKAAQSIPYCVSLFSLLFLVFAIDTVFRLAVKISTGENLYVYLAFSLPLIFVYLASSIICLASIPWLNLIAKRGEK